MNRRFLAAWTLAGAALAASLTACGSTHSASALATSSAVKSAEADTTALVTKCRPAGESASAWELKWATSFKPTLQAFETCEKIPAAKRPALYSCLLDGIKSAARTLGGTAKREAKFLAAANNCVKAAQA